MSNQNIVNVMNSALDDLELAQKDLPPVPLSAAMAQGWARKRRLVPLAAIGHVADLAQQNGNQVLGLAFEGDKAREVVRELEAIDALCKRARAIVRAVELDGLRRHVELADSAWRILRALQAVDGSPLAAGFAGRGDALRAQFPRRSRRRKGKEAKPAAPVAPTPG